jgi:hypothetical protein
MNQQACSEDYEKFDMDRFNLYEISLVEIY